MLEGDVIPKNHKQIKGIGRCTKVGESSFSLMHFIFLSYNFLLRYLPAIKFTLLNYIIHSHCLITEHFYHLPKKTLYP